MLSFMFAVLGSVIFWVVYVIVGLFVGPMTLKKFASRTWRFITTGEKHWCLCWMDVIVITIGHVILWPLTIIGFGFHFFFKYVITFVVWKPFFKLLTYIDKITPDVKIEKK